MRPHVLFRLPDGTLAQAAHGDLVGRLNTAAVHLDDARVSEAHALVSLREGSLSLLALRGRFAVDGRVLEQVELTAGQHIHLARDLLVVVEEIVLPAGVLALSGPGLPTQILPNVAALRREPDGVRLVPRYDSGADALLWTTGSGWRLRQGTSTRVVGPGDRFRVGDHHYDLVRIDLEAAAQEHTRREGGFAAPLHIEALYDVVNVHQDGVVVLTLGGLAARVIFELADIAQPVSWQAVAHEVWGAGTDDLRKRWDLLLARLRRRLRDAGLRQDLVHSDGHGNVALRLYEGDQAQAQA